MKKDQKSRIGDRSYSDCGSLTEPRVGSVFSLSAS